MTDKERILMAIITTVIPQLTYCCQSLADKEKLVKGHLYKPEDLKKGDLVFADTTIYPNDFMVGFVESVVPEMDYVLIREIGTDRCSRYYNETFTKINKEDLGYEILEGAQYKMYRKVLKAFEDTGYWTRFKSISFEDNMCTVCARKAFSDEFLFKISFPMGSTLKSIKELLKAEELKTKG